MTTISQEAPAGGGSAELVQTPAPPRCSGGSSTRELVRNAEAWAGPRSAEKNLRWGTFRLQGGALDLGSGDDSWALALRTCGLGKALPSTRGQGWAWSDLTCCD